MAVTWEAMRLCALPSLVLIAQGSLRRLLVPMATAFVPLVMVGLFHIKTVQPVAVFHALQISTKAV